jgi:hypothetical protein
MRGVRQGDSLRPLFFMLTMQKPLEELQQLALPAPPAAYPDDTFFYKAGPALDIILSYVLPYVSGNQCFPKQHMLLESFLPHKHPETPRILTTK